MKLICDCGNEEVFNTIDDMFEVILKEKNENFKW